MADQKITQLSEETAVTNDDFFVVVENASGATKKVQAQNIIPAGSIGTTDLADGGVTPAKLQSGTGTSWAWTNHTPTATGFSSTPIVAGRYIQIGKTVIFTFKVSGTSNATTATLTLPVNAKNTSNIIFETATTGVVDNSAGQANPGRAVIDASSSATTVALYKDSGGTAWTASGTKACTGTIIYEAS